MREPMVADREIEVFKVIRKDNRAPLVTSYHYRRGINKALGDATFIDGVGENVLVGGGYLHSYTVREDAYKLKEQLQDRMSVPCKVFKMYIPVGAKYYVSCDDNEMCSDTLVWKTFGRNIRSDEARDIFLRMEENRNRRINQINKRYE